MSRLEKLKQNRQEQPLVYSRTEKPKRESRLGGWLLLTVIAILGGGIVYLLFFSRVFNIKKVEVTGYENPKIIEEIVMAQGGEGVLASNIFIYNKKALADTLSGSPLISDIYIRKILPNKIIVEITESKPALIWSTAGEKYLIDERGAVIGKATGEELPTVFDTADINVERGDKVASPTFIKFIRGITDGFTAATQTKITKILIFDLVTDIHIVTSDGFTVYLDAQRDPKKELDNLSRVLTEARKTVKRLEYIDLRSQSRAFYK